MTNEAKTESRRSRVAGLTFSALAGVALVLALLPSGYLAWTARDMPHLGHFHDDGVYVVGAKSLAEGSGYRILSLPDQPYQTKYPPLYSLVLSWIWMIRPEFPENLGLTTLLAWVMLPVFLLLARSVFHDLGVRNRTAWVLCGLLALNPTIILFSFSAMSDLMFSCMMLAALLLAERARKPESSAPLAAAAGLLGGIAYLTRTAALPILLTAPLGFLLLKNYKRAVVFFIAMLPAVIGWNLWVRAHLSSKTDLVTVYYTDYIGYYLQAISWRDLPFIVWRNIEGVLSGIGGLILVNVEDLASLKVISRVLAILAIAGMIRVTKKAGFSQYFLFTSGYIALLILWTPVNERFFIPVFPFLLAGLYVELRQATRSIRSAFQSPEAGQRAFAVLTSAGLCLLGALFLYLTANAITVSLPKLIADDQKYLEDNRVAFRWISERLPEGATLLAQNDPVVYLYTGRRACPLKVPPILHYRRDKNLFEKQIRALPEYVRQQRLSHILFTANDYYPSDLERSGRGAAQKTVSENPAFRLIYESPTVSLYKILGDSAPSP